MRIEIRGEPTDREVAWRLIGDSEHLSRIGGVPPLTMGLVPAADGLPTMRGHMLGPAGIRHTFEDVDNHWVVGRQVRITRRLSGPLLKRTCYSAHLEEVGNGVRPIISLEVEPTTPLLLLPLRLGLMGLEIEWQKMIDALQPPGERPQPAPLLRRIDHGLDTAFRRWSDRGAPEVLIGQMRRLLCTARAWQLLRLCPFALARRWDWNPQEMLAWFIEATAAGLLELVFLIRCPRCGLAIHRLHAFAEITSAASCVSCRLEFLVDLSHHVEVQFAAAMYLGLQPGEHYCTLFPASRCDLLFMDVLDGGQRHELELELGVGPHRLVPTGSSASISLQVEADGPAIDQIEWCSTQSQQTLTLRPGRIRLVLENQAESRQRIMLRRIAPPESWVSGARLATCPAYRDRFGVPSLGVGVRTGVAGLMVLFTDLVDASVFYKTEGDFGSFTFIRNHYELLGSVVDEHLGSTVTMSGDSLMAVFVDPIAGLRAAIAMQQQFARWSLGQATEQPPILRVGLNYGSALAVHTPTTGLDYFGGMVNLASRAVYEARGGEVVWPDELHQDARLRPEIMGLQPAATPFEIGLGAGARQRMWRYQVPTRLQRLLAKTGEPPERVDPREA